MMLGKGLHLCCPRINRPSPAAPSLSQNSDHVPSPSSATPSSSVLKNFNSLYGSAADASDSETLAGFGSGSTSRTLITITADEDDDAASDSEPDLSTVFASRRLLRPASTDRSNSIVDGEDWLGFGVVPKLSPDPYEDFKRSLEEMVAALGLVECGDQREEQQVLRGAHQMRLHELLLCYLALNRKNAHKYIVGAFSDVLRGLTASGDSRRV